MAMATAMSTAMVMAMSTAMVMAMEMATAMAMVMATAMAMVMATAMAMEMATAMAMEMATATAMEMATATTIKNRYIKIYMKKNKKYYRYKIIYLSVQELLKKAGYKGKYNLSSLIEACGDKFFCLIRRTGSKKTNGIYWLANHVDEKGYGLPYVSAEEAVANLWLELNKK